MEAIYSVSFFILFSWIIFFLEKNFFYKVAFEKYWFSLNEKVSVKTYLGALVFATEIDVKYFITGSSFARISARIKSEFFNTFNQYSGMVKETSPRVYFSFSSLLFKYLLEFASSSGLSGLPRII